MTDDDIPYWKTVTAKKGDIFIQEPSRWDWQDYAQKYRSDPEGLKRTIQEKIDNFRNFIRSNLDKGLGIKKAEDYDDPHIGELQKIIDQMAIACGKFPVIPKLIIHQGNPLEDIFISGIDVSVNVPEFIESNAASIRYFISRPDIFKAVMAHEMGHIINDDQQNIENIILRMTSPPNRKEEILADLMGAIIYGKPRQYAEVNANHFGGGTGQHFHRRTPRYLSTNGHIRMLYKWANILEREGAIDDKGNVIPDRALAVFERSKEMIAGLINFENDFCR
jgi:hypothetical protein